MIDSFLMAGVAVLVYVTLIWILSLVLKNASIMDIFWGPGFILAAGLYYTFSPSTGNRGGLLLALVLIWGIRLAWHIGSRNAGEPEDARYAKWRSESKPEWWWRSFFKVFLLQGFILWIVSLPLLTGIQAAGNTALSGLDYLGLALWIVGFGFEAAGDWQLRSFKKRGGKGVFDGGLWRYTRHPNYFGESLIWWGFWILAVPAGSFWTIISPLLMTFLLIKVSGVAMLDELLERTKPEYRQYIKRTNAFIPGKPRKI